jgi:hypothetical protein
MSRAGDPPRLRWPAAAGALLAVVLLVTGCAQHDQVIAGAQPSTGPSIFPILPSDPATPAVVGDAVPGSGRAVATAVKLRGGAILPDRHVTPGAYFTDVTATDICDLHYSQGVRQPRFNAKVEAFANYGVSIHDRDVYQVDQLVPVVLGGSNEVGNLWPQALGGQRGAAVKDRLERHMRGLVCSDKLSLRAAQKAIAGNWWSAYKKFIGQTIDPGSAGLAPYAPSTPEAGEVVNGGTCRKRGKVGFTTGKRIALTCTANSLGQLRWAKRS